MKFRVIRQKTPSGANSPIQVVEQSTGKGVTWINRYLVEAQKADLFSAAMLVVQLQDHETSARIRIRPC